ncbi:MAG: endonuclease [Phycisphaerales bacterium]|nr:endonuclease [Phycisphaerales bacterium]
MSLVCSANALALNVGDLAIISFASDDPDAVAFVVLREIPSGTVIRFTDSGWQAGGGFRANEGGIQYNAPSTLSPGTVVSKSNPFTSGGWAINNAGVGASGFALSTSGDQILAFTGDPGSPAFVHAVNFDSAGYSDATSSNTTALPTGLTAGTSAVNIPEADNGYYSGTTTGTPEALLAAIGNPSNWTTSNSTITPPSWSFTVMGSGPLVGDVTLAASTFTVGQMTTVTVDLTGPPSPGSPVTVQLTSGAFSAPVNLVISNPNAFGIANVTMANEGNWTVIATAISGGTGSIETDAFAVGNPMTPPTADAGPDRNVELSGSIVTISLTGAMADDAEGLAGVDYEWTPVTTPGLVSWQYRSGAVNATTDPGTAQVTFNAVGAYVLTLTVTDADEIVATDTMTVSVNNPIPTDQFDPPAGYYSAATGQGSTLKMQLSSIITSGHVQQSYGDFKTSAAIYDADPEVPGNILLVYNRDSIPSAWTSGSTWSREHVWPQSLQPGDASDSSKGNLGDPYALRPVNPSINSSRGNKPFGIVSTTGAYGSVGSYYFPGDEDKGDIARSQFYSATRYMSTLSLVNGIPSGNQMGDLESMVRWHYTDVPDYFERRRCHLIYEDQHNRSPFVDRPEFVWSIFGDGANDSTLFVSPSEPLDGVSTIGLAYAPVIVGGPLPATTAITLSKEGTDPTYYLVSVIGDATSDVTGRFNAFDFGSQQRTINVGVSAITSIPGSYSGSVVVDNLDISSEGTGQGADDGDDTIDVSFTVYDHSDASFAGDADSNGLVIDFGTVSAAGGVQTVAFSIHNLASVSGFTAGLDLVAVTPAGDDDVLTTDVAPFAELASGQSLLFNAAIDPTMVSPGAYSATYVFDVADENLPGSTAGAPLTLTLQGVVSGAIFPFDDDGDGDVDNLDAINFVNCLSGPNGGVPTPECANHDWDEDGDIDLQDVAALQSAFTGMLP